MGTDAQFTAQIQSLLAPVPSIALRPMMGEYVLYFDGKVVGGLYDNRLLLKITAASREAFPSAAEVCPYPGAKNMLHITNLDARATHLALAQCLPALAASLPASKKKNTKKA